MGLRGREKGCAYRVDIASRCSDSLAIRDCNSFAFPFLYIFNALSYLIRPLQLFSPISLSLSLSLSVLCVSPFSSSHCPSVHAVKFISLSFTTCAHSFFFHFRQCLLYSLLPMLLTNSFSLFFPFFLFSFLFCPPPPLHLLFSLHILSS
jgi:hypothetical protein